MQYQKLLQHPTFIPDGVAMQRALFRGVARHLHLSAGKVHVDPGGILKVRLPKSCTLNVSPLNPHKFDWNHVCVSIDTPEQDDGPQEKVVQEKAGQIIDQIGLHFISETHGERSCVTIEAPNLAENSSVHVELPGLFDLDLCTGSGTVNINGTIEGDVRVHSKDANVKVDKLKSMFVDIQSDGGDVLADIIQGNITICTSRGDINIGKMQGPSVFLSSGVGNVHARAMYVENAIIQTKSGDIRLKGAQGSTSISTVSGDAYIGAVQGSLKVDTATGDIAVQLSHPKAVSLSSQSGDISVAIPDEKLNLKLLGDQISVDPAVTLIDVVKDENSQSISGSYCPSSASGVSNIGFGKRDYPSIKAQSNRGDVSLRLEKWGYQFTNIINRGLSSAAS